MNFNPLTEKVTLRNNIQIIKEEDNDLLERAKFVDDITVSEVIPKKKLELKTHQKMIGPSIFEDSSDF